MLEDRLSSENPFCTRRVRPGAVSYCFPAGETVDDIVDRLCRNQWWGAIVGPHGTGKSTLLALLLKTIENAGRQVILFELHDGQRCLPRDWRRKIEPLIITAPAVVVIDGYEQLNSWNRFWLKRYCRKRHLGLLVTSHVSVGLPEVYHTSSSPEMSQQVVETLMQNEKTAIAPEIISELFAQHGGNIREMLFDLYDLFEQRQ